MAPPNIEATPTIESLRPRFLAAGLDKLFADIWGAQDAPDYGGPRWLEVYRGSAMDATFVCVDFIGNALHVVRDGREGLTLTYVPGWFYDVVTRSLSFNLRDDVSTAWVKDLQAAAPMRIELEVMHPLAEAGAWTVGGEAYAYTPLPFGYEYEPAHAFAVEPTAPEASGIAAWMPSAQPVPVAELVHWSAMKLRLLVAPGVKVIHRSLVGKQLLDAARQGYVPHWAEGVSCEQALQFELERRQNLDSLCGLGARHRPTPLAETDIVAGSVARPSGSALALELTRPDGVDILLARPGPRTRPPHWLLEVVGGAVREVIAGFIALQGGIPPEAPLPIRIRVEDINSPDQRFVYRLRYLDRFGDAQAEPLPVWDVDEELGLIQLSVIRTKGVSVTLDTSLSNWGKGKIEQIVDYREAVEHIADVPWFLDDDNEPKTRTTLETRATSLEEILAVAWLVGEFVPLPWVQAMYDLRDAGHLASYILNGTDMTGAEMTAVDAAITVAGFVLPEVGERSLKLLRHSARRLRTVGADPFWGLVLTADALEAADLAVIKELAPDLELP